MLHTSDLWNCRVKNELLILKNCFLNSYIENCKQGVPKCEELLQKKATIYWQCAQSKQKNFLLCFKLIACIKAACE